MNEERICANCAHCDEETAVPYFCLVRMLETRCCGFCDEFMSYPPIVVL